MSGLISSLASHIPLVGSHLSGTETSTTGGFTSGKEFEQAKLASYASGSPAESEDSPATSIKSAISANFTQASADRMNGGTEIKAGLGSLMHLDLGTGMRGLASGIFDSFKGIAKLPLGIPMGIASASLGKVGAATQVVFHPLKTAEAVSGRIEGKLGFNPND